MQSELALNLEFYLCGAFQLIDFTQSRRIWCDGILELAIDRIHRRAFLLTGVAYGPQKLAPFEIEFHFARRRDQEPTRTIVRFAELDSDGEIKWHTKATNAATIVANRPQCNRDWAVAVEITPASRF